MACSSVTPYHLPDRPVAPNVVVYRFVSFLSALSCGITDGLQCGFVGGAGEGEMLSYAQRAARATPRILVTHNLATGVRHHVLTTIGGVEHLWGSVLVDAIQFPCSDWTAVLAAACQRHALSDAHCGGYPRHRWRSVRAESSQRNHGRSRRPCSGH